MSNRREPHTSSVLNALTGRHLPGGCDDCHAYQTVEPVDGVYLLAVHHDTTCPLLAVMEGRACRYCERPLETCSRIPGGCCGVCDHAEASPR